MEEAEASADDYATGDGRLAVVGFSCRSRSVKAHGWAIVSPMRPCFPQPLHQCCLPQGSGRQSAELQHPAWAADDTEQEGGRGGEEGQGGGAHVEKEGLLGHDPREGSGNDGPSSPPFLRLRGHHRTAE